MTPTPRTPLRRGQPQELSPVPSGALTRRRAAEGRRRRSGHAGATGRRRAGPLWLFDLDNTLHHASHAIFPHINREMTAFIERVLDVDRETANRLRVFYTRRYGAALLGLVRQHGIDAHAFLRDVHPSETLAQMVRGERGLRRTLAQLPGRKIVLTNGPADYAHAILQMLGIHRQFERVVAIEDMRRGSHWQAKPESAVLRRVLRRNGVPLTHADQAVLVEDTHGHLKRYRHLGIRTVWITGFIPVRNTAARAASVAALQTALAGGEANVANPAASPGSPDLRRHLVAPPRIGAGRPHYVDHKIRALAGLRRKTLRPL